MNKLLKLGFFKKSWYVLLLIFNTQKFIEIEIKHDQELPDLNENFAPPRAVILKNSLLLSLFIVLSAGILGFFISLGILFYNYELTRNGIVILQISSALFLLWGTLFLRGWEIQSYIGETLTERINQFIYRSLYFIGTVLIVLTLL